MPRLTLSSGGGGIGFGVAFSLHDQFSDVAKNIQGSFGGLGEGIDNMAGKVDASFGRLYAGIGLIGTGIGLMAPVGLGIKYAGEFEQAEIALTTLLKSEDEAHKVFEQIKQDAAVTPFNTKDLLAGEIALISTGLSADRAREDILNLGNAVSGAGRGTEELQRMAINMQQIANTGQASAIDVRQFGIAGINIFKLLSQATGKTMDEVKQMPVTYDMISLALKRGAQAGGMYENAMDRQSRSINGKFSTIQDNVQFSLAAIGNAVMKYVHPALDRIIDLLDKFQKWAVTDAGQAVISFAVISLALLGITIAGEGVMLFFAGVGEMITAALTPILPFIIAFAILIYLAQDAVGGFTNLKTVLMALKEVFMSAGHEGFAMGEDTKAALDKIGLTDFVVAMGTWFVRIKEFFSGMIDGFKEVYGVVYSVMSVIWTIVVAVWDAIIAVLKFFGVEMGKNTSSLTAWAEAGKIVAWVVGVALVIALGSLIVSLIATAVAWIAAFIIPILIIAAVVAVLWVLWEVIQWVWNILKAVGQWLASAFTATISAVSAYFMFWWNIMMGIANFLYDVFMVAVNAVGDAISWLADALQPVWDAFSSFFSTIADGFTGLWTLITGFVGFFFNLGKTMWDAGANFITQLWEGVKNIWSKFTSWLSDAWHNSWIGSAVDWLIGDSSSDLENKAGESGAIQGQTDAQNGGISQDGLQAIAQQKAGATVGLQPTVIQTNSERVSSITIPVVVDGETIQKTLINREQMDQARQ